MAGSKKGIKDYDVIDDSPENPPLTKDDITQLRHRQLEIKVERTLEEKNRKKDEHIQTIRRGNAMFDKCSVIEKECKKLDEEIQDLRQIRQEKMIKKGWETEINLKKEEKKIMGLTDEIFKERRAIWKTDEELDKEEKALDDKIKTLEYIDLYEDRLIAVEEWNKEEIVLIEKQISNMILRNVNLARQIDFYKTNKVFKNKKIDLMEEELRSDKVKEEQDARIKEQQVRDKIKNQLRNAYKIRNKHKWDTLWTLSFITQEEIILDFLSSIFTNNYTNSKGIKEICDIMMKEKDPHKALNDIIECADKRLGFFQSWYSQSSFFGKGRKDWVNELYLTLSFMKKYKNVDPKNIMSMLRKINNNAIAQNNEETKFRNLKT